jgi:anti-sigma regulatory factor (Ser/Thr protein kinase)
MSARQDFRLLGQIKLFTGDGFLQQVRDAVIALVTPYIDADKHYDIQLVCSEIAQNIYVHGYGKQHGAPVLIDVMFSSQLLLVIRDHSAAPTHAMQSRADLAELEVGKRGLAIVQKLTQDYTYERTGNGAKHTILMGT